MKKLLLLLCLLFTVSSYAQPTAVQPFSTYFDFGGDSTAYRTTVARKVIADSTGIYCFGNTIKGIKYISTFAAKFAYDGTLLWKRFYRTPGYLNFLASGNTVVPIEHGFLVAGVDADTSCRDSAWVNQPFLFFINKSGDSVRLIKHIDSIHDRTLYSAYQNPDKTIMTAGIWGSASRTYDTPQRRYIVDSNSLYLVKYDSVGNILWERTYFLTRNIAAHPLKIARAADGGILMGGWTSVGFANGYGHFFAKLDSNGNILWSRRYPFNNNNNFGYDAPDLVALPDGGFYFTYMANTRPPTTVAGDYNALFAYGRANAQGDTLWLRLQADSTKDTTTPLQFSAPCSLFMDNNHNLYIQGHVVDSGAFVPAVLFTDSNGRIKSKRIYNPYSFYGTSFMTRTIRTPYNTLVHFSSATFQDTVPNLINQTGTYCWLLQTDSFGCIQPGCEIADSIWHYNPTAVVTTQQYEQVILYPNPASHAVTLEGVPLNSHYEIVDMKGTSAGSGIIQEQRTIINVESLVPGVYIIRIRIKDKPPVRLRLVKE